MHNSISIASKKISSIKILKRHNTFNAFSLHFVLNFKTSCRITDNFANFIIRNRACHTLCVQFIKFVFLLSFFYFERGAYLNGKFSKITSLNEILITTFYANSYSVNKVCKFVLLDQILKCKMSKLSERKCVIIHNKRSGKEFNPRGSEV